MISVESQEFLKPIYEAIEQKKPLVLEIGYRSGSKNYHLVESKTQFEDIRRNLWRPRAYVSVIFNPEILFRGPSSFDVLRIFWDNPNLYTLVQKGTDTYLHLVSAAESFDAFRGFEGDVTIIRELNFNLADDYGVVPMRDGTLKC